jgi:hypothetical protein
LAVLSLPAALARDHGDQPARSGAVVPSCFMSGEALWNTAGHHTLVCTPKASATVPKLGSTCWQMSLQPVTFAIQRDGRIQARFALAAGGIEGALPVEVGSIPSNMPEAYVVDMRLGSYEPSDASDPTSPVVCRLASTWHFYCPVSQTLDRICLTWRRSSARAGEGCGNGR